MKKLLIAVAGLFVTAAFAADPLPSWNDTAPRKAIIQFVEKVTKPGSPDFVPAAERIATFDNDGTLWAEQPVYFQLLFVADRVQALTPKHPEWKTTEPFASLLKGDLKGVAGAGEKGLAALLAATHAGMTTEEFDRSVSAWIGSARHPKTGMLYTEMVYQPMLELLAYLRANGFKTYIAAFGNSDGDLQMLQWTAAGSGARFCLFVHHDDAGREWAYDRKSPIGRLDKGLDEAKARGWTVVSMKDDWKTIFPR